MKEYTREAWIAYTGTAKNFELYCEARKHCQRSKWFFIGLFGSYIAANLTLAYLIYIGRVVIV